MTIAQPGEQPYAAATAVFNLAAPAEPAAAVTARTVADVQAAIGHAKADGRPVRVHATGHGAASVRPMTGSVLIRTDLNGGVRVDPGSRIARIPAGTRWGAVIDAAAAHGLAAPHGSSPLVGAVGYLLRGGLSFYGRRIGIAASRVRAIELVTADGRARRVSAAEDPGLFWALRGGGGGFGVVTAVDVELFPVAKVITGSTWWRGEHAEGLLAAWLRWTKDAPRDATTSLRLMNLPDLPEVPPELSGGTVVCVDGAVVAETDADLAAAERIAADLLSPLRAVGEPVMDTWEVADPPALAHTHMDPTEPFPIHGDHMLLNDLGEDGAAEFLRVAGPGSGSPLINVELRQLGGAFAEPGPEGGALDHLSAPFAYLGGGVPMGGVTMEEIVAHCGTVRAALRPWDSGRTTPSFVENVDQPQGHLTGVQVEAVDRVRNRVDPSGLFRAEIAPNATLLARVGERAA